MCIRDSINAEYMAQSTWGMQYHSLLMKRFNNVLILAAIVIVIVSSKSWVYYNQCNPLWAELPVVPYETTLCSSGSLITTIAMILSTNEVSCGQETCTPDIILAFARNKRAMLDNYVNPSAFQGLGLRYLGRHSSLDAVQTADFNDRYAYVFKVRTGDWVLATGKQGNDFIISDPATHIRKIGPEEVLAVHVFMFESQAVSQCSYSISGPCYLSYFKVVSSYMDLCCSFSSRRYR
eukprot:TRINITY_DN2005_c0_g1_i3.p1 TRINITY_DN2005_c0_g1~~TRINITY_DN2005_c0_g1_i3.p1  ORF type:complete len:255 (+),score=41.92 TRINITY_DN2005_c0_g1_i3:61-765(+)